MLKDRGWRPVAAGASLVVSVACSSGAPSPGGPDVVPSVVRADAAPSGADAQGGGPETPPFNLEVVLRGEGFGLVKFRQPNDAVAVVFLDTWVRDLKPGTAYLLQRAVDPVTDDHCTSEAWLTLGKGPEPQAITTDERGAGREELWRDLSAFPAGTAFDIHFRVVEEATQAVALRSRCYQFRISL